MTTPPADSTNTDTHECQNCGSTNVSTNSVRRVYLAPDAPDDLDAAIIEDDVERWCAACVANYPHLEVNAS